jgi:L-threonylcarbamoyladenylate synthase
MLKKGIVKLEDSLKRSKEIIESIKAGMLFIYPTDTIYGLGCDATNSNAVKKLRKLKKRYNKPLSTIAPSRQWILDNCNVKKKFLAYISKLPAPFTFIVSMKRKNAVSEEVTDTNSLGVRMPKHEFTKIIQKAGKPFITTSVNIAGEKHATSIQEIPWRMKRHCIIIDAGRLEGTPSTIFDLTGEKAKLIQR